MNLKNNFRSFASDNNSPIDKNILKAIVEANANHAIGYGDDICTKNLFKLIKDKLGNSIVPFITFNGTGANTLAIKQIVRPYNSVICAETAHINVDETSAPENLTGCKLLPVKTKNGKLTIEDIKPFLSVKGDIHHSQPKVVSISNTTELGTVYTKEELIKLSEFCHKNGLILYCDGARLANAAASLDCDIKDITIDANLDIFTIGGTKNGLLAGELLIFNNKKIADGFQFLHKTGLQLASKMRYFSAQFIAYLEKDLWKINAKHANNMAKLLETKLKEIKSIKFVYPVEANALFIKLEKVLIEKLLKKYFFYIWDEKENIIRLMTSFDTTQKDIDDFIDYFCSVLK